MNFHKSLNDLQKLRLNSFTLKHVSFIKLQLNVIEDKFSPLISRNYARGGS